MPRLMGFLLIFFGVLVLVAGDRRIPVKGGIVLQLFSAPDNPFGRRRVKVMKWAAGLLVIWFGVYLLFFGKL